MPSTTAPTTSFPLPRDASASSFPRVARLNHLRDAVAVVPRPSSTTAPRTTTSRRGRGRDATRSALGYRLVVPGAVGGLGAMPCRRAGALPARASAANGAAPPDRDFGIAVEVEPPLLRRGFGSMLVVGLSVSVGASAEIPPPKTLCPCRGKRTRFPSLRAVEVIRARATPGGPAAVSRLPADRRSSRARGAGRALPAARPQPRPALRTRWRAA